MSDSMADAGEQLLVFLKSVDSPHVTTVTGVLQAMRTIRTFMESTDPEMLDEVQMKAWLVIEPVVNTVFKVYIFTTNRIASISTTFGDILGLEAQIPDDVRPKVDEIRVYLEKAEAVMAEINTVAQDLAAKIEQACENENISQIEIKKFQKVKTRLSNKLKICEVYVNAADEALRKLKDDLMGKVGEVVFTSAATACGAGTLLTAEASVPAVLAGVGVAAVCFKLLKIVYNYSHVLSVECTKLDTEFRIVKVDFSVAKRIVKDLKKELEEEKKQQEMTLE